MVICGFIFRYKSALCDRQIGCIQLLKSIGKYSYYMYLNEAFIIGCVQKIVPIKLDNKILETIMVISISYIFTFVFDKTYKCILKTKNKIN